MMLVLYGPTVTGKTNLAIEIAKKYNGELISADSRQIFKRLDIGTGKVSSNSTVKKFPDYWIVDGVKIYGFDIKNPQESFSAAAFIDYAQDCIYNIQREKKLPIVVGGTGFYIKSLLFGIGTSGVEPNINLRKKLKELTVAELYETLLRLNSVKALSLNESDRYNPRRLTRAIEVAASKKLPNTGKPITANQYKIIVLSAPNKFLYLRADAWLEKRLELGLEKEIQSLLASGIDSHWLESLGLEYKWLTQASLGIISKDEAINRLKGDIHAYIRRQKTFIRQLKKIDIFDISKKDWKKSLEKNLSKLEKISTT